LIGSKKQQEKEDAASIISKLEIDESVGELLCDKCEGRGGTSYNEPSSDVTKPQWIRCPKCQGRGKVDWVSHITGVPKKPDMFHFGSSSMYSTYSCGTSGVANMHDDIIDAMAQNLAKKIDEEILESIMKGSNKNIKLYDQEVKQVDNGIFSKFLFHTNT